jgi:RNA polymerase II subunit A small phosphatase-like protein
VEKFLEFCGRHFEVVIFTASLATYADPVIDFLDKTRIVKHRLYRDSCVFVEGLYLKDLSRLGRPLDQTILVDNAATSYLLQPENGVAIKSWFNDLEDTELLERLQPALEELPRSPDVYKWKAAWSHLISD